MILNSVNNVAITCKDSIQHTLAENSVLKSDTTDFGTEYVDITEQINRSATLSAFLLGGHPIMAHFE